MADNTARYEWDYFAREREALIHVIPWGSEDKGIALLCGVDVDRPLHPPMTLIRNGDY